MYSRLVWMIFAVCYIKLFCVVVIMKL